MHLSDDMGIKLFPNTKIYVISPANMFTGGPEALHQLVYHLRKNLKLDAYMFYQPTNHPNPISSNLKQYNNPFVREIEDNEENILISPEPITYIKTMKKYKHIRKIIWWLSIDNFYYSVYSSSKKNLLIRAVNKTSSTLFKKNLFDVNTLNSEGISLVAGKISIPDETILAHFVQSTYALKHLESKGIKKEKIYYISDYLNENFLKINTNLSKKKDLVAYNPKKGFIFTKRIINSAKNIRFIPIENMSRNKVIKLLQEAKCYIDFGNHPGKDRIPREAAMLGCCVITGKKGSANYFEDLPIPDRYKFNDTDENIPLIVNELTDCIKNFKRRYKEFNRYRNAIKKQSKGFLSDIKIIFSD